MKFEFETEIIESKGAVNTAAKIAQILKDAKVFFGVTKTGIPGIWVKFGEKEKENVALLRHNKTYNISNLYNVGEKWLTAYPQRGHEEYEYQCLFEHLTNAAEQLVSTWIIALCDEYDRRLEADEKPQEP